VLQVISSVVLTIVPILLYEKYNPSGKHIYGRNNTDEEKGREEKEEEDEDKKRKTHELLDEGVKGGYTL
jgi:hypothetical protein